MDYNKYATPPREKHEAKQLVAKLLEAVLPDASRRPAQGTYPRQLPSVPLWSGKPQVKLLYSMQYMSDLLPLRIILCSPPRV